MTNTDVRVIVIWVREGSLVQVIIKILMLFGGATGAFYIRRKKMKQCRERWDEREGGEEERKVLYMGQS